jgi:hypothetical protein
MSWTTGVAGSIEEVLFVDTLRRINESWTARNPEGGGSKSTRSSWTDPQANESRLVSSGEQIESVPNNKKSQGVRRGWNWKWFSRKVQEGCKIRRTYRIFGYTRRDKLFIFVSGVSSQRKATANDQRLTAVFKERLQQLCRTSG